MGSFVVPLAPKVLLRGMDVSENCETLCTQLAQLEQWKSRMNDPSIVIDSVSVNYFRCYMHDLGNNENLLNLPKTGADILCSGIPRMFYLHTYSDILKNVKTFGQIEKVFSKEIQFFYRFLNSLSGFRFRTVFTLCKFLHFLN